MNSQLLEYDSAVETLHAATALYTADPIVDQLLDKFNWPDNEKILVDPACGNGQFLLRALERLLSSNRADLNCLKKIQGYEIHSGACEEARQRVTTRLVVAGWPPLLAKATARQMVLNKDFLTEGPVSPAADFYVLNPPFIRKLKIPLVLRNQYQNTVPKFASNDLLHSFIERCSRCLRAGGKIGLISSDRWLFSVNASGLRDHIGKTFLIEHYEKLDAKTAFFRPKKRQAGTPPRIHPIAVVLSGDANSETIPITRQAMYPGLRNDAYMGFPTLGSLAQVKVGPWLGPDKIFIVDFNTAMKFPREFLVPILEAADIHGGTLSPPSRFAIKTMPGVIPPESIRNHLCAMAPRMPARGKRISEWLPPETFHAWNLNKPSLFIPRISKTAFAYFVPPGRLPIDHNLSITSDDELLLGLIENSLRNPLTTKWIEERAPKLENGYFMLGATLLRSLPIFDLPV